MLFLFSFIKNSLNMSYARAVASAFLVFALPWLAHAQKVALVLSGGGAKGLAHVGVIKALEENDIPIDYLVGTSMGGIVAACYASGMSADEIEEVMLSEDFSKWVNGELEDGYNYYYSQDDPGSAFLTLEFSLDSILNATIISSLASDLSLNFALMERFAQPAANANYDFDSLFRPVRIIAADIFTQHEVAIDSGSLGSAVRTTLSVPFFYKPIRFKGKYLFDGGIYNNFPIDVAQREFEPDVIIGTNVSSKIFDEYPFDEDESLLNNSLLFMLLDKSDPSNIPESGIYVEPNLGGYTAFDFASARSLIDSGYQQTIRQIDEIKSKVTRRISCENRSTARNEFTNKNTPFSFKDIVFHGFNSKQRKFIRSVFKFKPGKILYLNDIKKGYFRLLSEQYFRTIYPDIIYNDATQAYELHLYGRPRSNLNLEIGGSITTRSISQIYLGLEYYYFDNYLLKNTLRFYSGSFYKSAQVKSRINLPALGQFYIEPEYVYNDWDYLEEDDLFKPERGPTILTRTDRKYGINLGRPLGIKYKAVLHASYVNNTDHFSNLNSFTSLDTLDELGLKGFRTGLEISKNDLNRNQYASNGTAFRLKLDYYNLDEDYIPGNTSENQTSNKASHEWVRANITLEQYFRMGRYSLGYFAQGNFSNQPFFSNYKATVVNAPGFEELQDSPTLFLEKFKGFNYATLGLRNVISLGRNLDFRIEGYAFKPFRTIVADEKDNAVFNSDLTDIRVAFNSGLVFHSPIGPIAINANYYDDENHRWGFFMHIGYLLFQERSLD